MKLTFGLFLAFVAAVSAQTTVTEDFLAAQADLALGHEFFEQTLFLNRGQISAYLYRINREIIDSHINTYAFIKNLGLDTLAEFEAIPRTPANDQCLDNIINRWDLQITRYGHRLATCVNGAYRLIRDTNEVINGLHATGQVSVNQVQNLILSVLSETEVFDGTNDFARDISRAYRELLTRAILPYRELVEEFLEDISTEILDTIAALISCDVDLEADFQREVETDMARAQNCAQLG